MYLVVFYLRRKVVLSSSSIRRGNDGAIPANCLSTVRENGGANLAYCLTTDHRTAARPAVTTIYSRQGGRWCCPLLAFRERTLLLSSRCVLSTRPVKRAILAAKGHNWHTVSGAITAFNGRHPGEVFKGRMMVLFSPLVSLQIIALLRV